MTAVDVVVVSYNSRDRLSACLRPLLAIDAVRAIVVDNASSDGSIESIADLPVTTRPLGTNMGFAHGCNVGWRAGDAPYVLLLNPDAAIDERSLRLLTEVLDADPQVGAAAPRIRNIDGSAEYSLRRFPRVRTTFAQALFLHRLFPNASWGDEVIRDERVYAAPGEPEWVSGACVLIRREALALLHGLDEGFFLYCEDIDLCRRIWQAGFKIVYVPDAVALHEGGASAPRAQLLPVLARSRIRYAYKHRSRADAALERAGIALEALTHMLISKGGLAARSGFARSFVVAVSPLRSR